MKNYKIVLLLIALTYTVSAFMFRHKTDFCLVANGDAVGYYTYLPAFFIHHDLRDLRKTTLARNNQMPGREVNKLRLEDLGDGHFTGRALGNDRHIIQYTCGVAILQSPSFFLAHLTAKLMGYEADGYTPLYRIFLLFNGLLFGIFGLWVTAKILEKEGINSKIINFTLISVGLATNLYYFSTVNAYMSHAYLFALWALVIFLTQKFYTEGLQNRHLWLMAFVLGFIAIIRPVDIVITLVPLLYGIKKWSDVGARFRLIWQKKIPLIAALFFGILPILPQLFYWHHVTGHWIFNSYLGQTFDFSKVRIMVGWFSFQNGWLIYTPIMAFAVVGIFLSFKRSAFALPILLLLPLYAYIIHAWWCWNYINGFGMRPMVDTYALLAIPLSIFLLKTTQKPVFRGFFTLIIAFFIWLNIFQTWQSVEEILISENGNRAYWLSIFGKKSLDYNNLVAFDSNELQPSTPPDRLILLRENTFEDTTNHQNNTHFVKEPVKTGQLAYLIPPEGYAPDFKISVKELGGSKMVKATLSAYATDDNFYDIWHKCILIVSFSRGDKNLKWVQIRLENKLGQSSKIFAGKTRIWGDIQFYVKTPSDLRETDELQVKVLNSNTGSVLIDDFRVFACH